MIVKYFVIGYKIGNFVTKISLGVFNVNFIDGLRILRVFFWTIRGLVFVNKDGIDYGEN